MVIVARGIARLPREDADQHEAVADGAGPSGHA